VVLFTTSPGKAGDAKRFGAHEVVLSRDEEAMKRQLNSFDFILDTASGKHDLNAYLELLKHDGMLTLVGIPAEPEAISVMPLVRRRRGLTGSLIGGIAETQEMLDFCADRGITCEIEMIPMEQINEAYERMLKSDVKLSVCDRRGEVEIGRGQRSDVSQLRSGDLGLVKPDSAPERLGWQRRIEDLHHLLQDLNEHVDSRFPDRSPVSQTDMQSIRRRPRTSYSSERRAGCKEHLQPVRRHAQ